MNKFVNKFLMARNNFMQELHVRQPGFTYSACPTFAKHHERIQKFKETGNLKYICKNGLDKVCFSHDLVYSNSKELVKRIISDKILKDKSL